MNEVHRVRWERPVPDELGSWLLPSRPGRQPLKSFAQVVLVLSERKHIQE
jgi:hypothetical protein